MYPPQVTPDERYGDQDEAEWEQGIQHVPQGEDSGLGVAESPGGQAIREQQGQAHPKGYHLGASHGEAGPFLQRHSDGEEPLEADEYEQPVAVGGEVVKAQDGQVEGLGALHDHPVVLDKLQGRADEDGQQVRHGQETHVERGRGHGERDQCDDGQSVAQHARHQGHPEKDGERRVRRQTQGSDAVLDIL